MSLCKAEPLQWHHLKSHACVVAYAEHALLVTVMISSSHPPTQDPLLHTCILTLYVWEEKRQLLAKQSIHAAFSLIKRCRRDVHVRWRLKPERLVEEVEAGVWYVQFACKWSLQKHVLWQKGRRMLSSEVKYLCLFQCSTQDFPF